MPCASIVVGETLLLPTFPFNKIKLDKVTPGAAILKIPAEALKVEKAFGLSGVPPEINKLATLT